MNNKKSLVCILILVLTSSTAVGMLTSTNAAPVTEITLPCTITAPGHYKITEPWNGTGPALQINASDVTVIGQNNLIQLNQTEGDFAITIAPGCSNVLLRSINETGARYGLLAQEASFKVEASTFENNTDVAVFAYNSTDCSVNSVIASNSSLGIYTYFSRNISVEYCSIQSNSYGIATIYSDYVLVRGCYINNNTQGVHFEAGSNVTLADSILTGNEINALASGVSHITVDNTAFGNASIGSIAFGTNDFTIMNSCLANNTLGLFGVNLDNFLISNVSVTHNQLGAFLPTCNVTITGADLSFNQGYGALLGACNATISNISVANNTQGVISELCRSLTVQHCLFSNNSEIGMSEYGGNSTLINSNGFIQNGLDVAAASGGLLVEDSNCTVTSNLFDSNFDALLMGVYDNQTIAQQTYHSNVFRGNNYTMDFNYQLSSDFANQQIYFYNNFINDTCYLNPDSFSEDFQLAPPTTVFHLNTTQQAGNRIYSGGPEIGGNYWAHPNGTGYSEIEADANHDGFADAPFDFFGNGTVYDYLPYTSGYVQNLAFIGGDSQSLVVNQTSTKITVNYFDYAGNLTTGLSVNLSSNSSAGKFFSDLAGTQQISSITIPEGSSAASFYYKDLSVGTPILSASAEGVASAATNFTISSHAPAIDHLVISPAGATIAARDNITFTITAYDQYGNAWNVTAQYGLNGGSIGGDTIMGTIAGMYYVQAYYEGVSAETYLIVTPGALDRFAVLVPTSATVDTPFPIRVVALDAAGNVVTGFSGTVTLSINGTSDSSSQTGDFKDGIWTGSITISDIGSFSVKADDGNGHSGTSGIFSINSASSPSPSPSTTPTETIQATTEGGSKINLPISGNITSIQYSNIHITTDEDTATTTISFSISGQSGTTGLGNITISKSDVLFGGLPMVYIDGDAAENQGFTEDAANFYVWFTTQFSTHHVEVVFVGEATTQAPMPTIWFAVIIAVVVVALVAAAFAVTRRRKR